MRPIGVRWTIGDVSENGWTALRLAVLGARRVFGPADGVEWLAVTREDVPTAVRRRFDAGMAEGVAWKLAPLRVFPDRWELSFDNDCIL